MGKYYTNEYLAAPAVHDCAKVDSQAVASPRHRGGEAARVIRQRNQQANERTLYPADKTSARNTRPRAGRSKPAATSISRSSDRSSSPSSARAAAARPPSSRWWRAWQPYTSGTITVGGKRVDSPQTDVGIVFQEAIMLDWRDVLANVMLQIDIRKMDRAEIRAGRAKSAQGHRPRRLRRARSPMSCPAACASACRSAARWCTVRPC